MYAIKVGSNILPYCYEHYDVAVKAAARRREMTDAPVKVVWKDESSCPQRGVAGGERGEELEKRICPECGGKVYSADGRGDWECPYCGADISRPKE